jgi:hypothetical protein
VTTKLQFIDPADCGCTDCITGRAVPLDRASNGEINRLLRGRLIARLDADAEFELELTLRIGVQDVNTGGLADHLVDALDAADNTTVTVHTRTFYLRG